MRNPTARTCAAVAAAVAPALAGCAGSPTDAKGIDDLRRAVVEANRPLDEIADRLDERLSSQYTNRDAFIAAISETELDTVLADVARAAREMQPPPAYAEDHARWVAWLDDAAVDAEAMLLAADNDVLDLASTHAVRFQAGFERLLVEVSGPFCEALTEAEERFGRRRCDRPDDLPAGVYGVEANQIARELAAGVFPLIGSAPLGLLHPEEERTFLGRIQPVVEAELRRAGERLGSLRPPVLLRDDHEAARTYVRELADIAQRITAAAAAGDMDALPRLYIESGGPGARLEAALDEHGRKVFLPLLGEQA